jgi:putative ABC transport system permease protein
MRLKKSFHLALNLLFHSKLRSWLTIIGIIIGMAAVVAIISISQGAEQQLQQRLGSLGANVLTITPGASRASGIGFGGGAGGFGGFGGGGSAVTTQKNLTSKDILAIESVPNVEYVMGSVSGRADVSFSGKTSSKMNCQGVDISVWKDITTETLAAGRFLTSGDSYSVVIGSNVANTLFGTPVSLNDKLIIGGQTFNVVGIVESGSSIYMPIDIARNVLEDAEGNFFSSISVKITDVSLANDTVNAITDRLSLSRGILQAKKQDFSVSNPAAAQQTIQQTLGTMTLFLGAIAAISLLVGAIGIANTMFTSVLERTNDIGIMKAIGARNRDVLSIFILNSGLIGLIGGLGGVILGSIASTLISSAAGIGTSVAGGRGGLGNLFGSSYVSPGLIIGVLLFSIAIGMIAGIIPAIRASKLSPVDALRYE